MLEKTISSIDKIDSACNTKPVDMDDIIDGLSIEINLIQEHLMYKKRIKTKKTNTSKRNLK